MLRYDARLTVTLSYGEHFPKFDEGTKRIFR